MSKSSLLREPLLHFLVLGLFIFAGDSYLRWVGDERHTIQIDDAVERSLVSLFREGQGREPTEAEISMLVHRWLQNEVYYREALSLGLDRGDEMIHSRLILKMREVVLNNIVVTPPSDEELRGWFEANRTRYDIPERYDFSQFLVAELGSGSRAQAEDLLTTIADRVPAPYADLVRSYGERTPDNIADMFGAAFASNLLADREPKWRVLQSSQGWHVVRLDTVHAAIPASFGVIRVNVKADWEAMQKTTAAFEAIKEMRKRYKLTGPGLKYLDIQPAVPQTASEPGVSASGAVGKVGSQ